MAKRCISISKRTHSKENFETLLPFEVFLSVERERIQGNVFICRENSECLRTPWLKYGS
jgi:hypothetical protein